MVSSGMAAAGYEYINIDAGYLTHKRDPTTSKLVVNPTKFPHGIRHVADYIHNLGLKLGVRVQRGKPILKKLPHRR